MKAVKLKDNIYWVGGIDWNLRNFHGYLTQKGSTYNAYLITGEKNILIDTVKHYLVDEMFQRISSVIPLDKIDYIICNHVEMDHSGGIPCIMEKFPNIEIVTSPNGQRNLKNHYKKNWNFKIVKTGDELTLGDKTFKFLLSPMVHWPDNMLSYIQKDKILFSNDAFGQHIASSERFDNEIPDSLFFNEAKKYYANIVMPYGSQVQKLIKDVTPDFDFELVAPSHGVVIKKNITSLAEKYNSWSLNESENKAVVVYDTMWNSTLKIANAIISAFDDKGINVKLYNLQATHISDIMTDILTSKYVCVGSPTLNNNILPTVSAFLTYLKGLAPKNRVALAFGSYGWGGQSISIINDILASCNFDMLTPVKYQFVPDDEFLKNVTETLKAEL